MIILIYFDWNYNSHDLCRPVEIEGLPNWIKGLMVGNLSDV